MKIKALSAFLLGVSVATSVAVAHADNINARAKSVDVAAHTFTVIEGGKDYTFSVNDATKFVDSAGVAITGRAKLDSFKPGTRLSIAYAKKDDKATASEVKVRDKK